MQSRLNQGTHTASQFTLENTQQSLELAALIERFTGADGTHRTPIAALELFRTSAPSEPVHGVYEPAICIVAQGSKQLLLAENCYLYDSQRYLLVSVDLPVVGQVTAATVRVPYLALRLALEPAQIGEIIMQMDLSSEVSNRHSDINRSGRGLAISPLTPTLLDAVIRLVKLLETPQDIATLAPLLKHEIIYRLLIGEQGARLRQIALSSSQTHRVAQAIDWIKNHYAQPVSIEDLARVAHMSASGLHHHFKAVTAMSPLQYQKHLRLQEARRLMLGEDLDAATVGYRVGYQSPSQFSREYSRLFGAPPLRDIARLRNGSFNASD